MNVMKRYLTEEEQARLLKTINQYAASDAKRDYAWIRLLLSTGMRIGEFSQLTVGDAITALQTGYIFIPKEHRKGWNRTAKLCQNGQERIAKPPKDHTVYVTQPVRESLQALLVVRIELDYQEDHDAPLVMSRKHGPLSIRAYQQRVTYWAKQAGLPDGISPHWFRHTRAMNIMHKTTSNDPRGIVQATLGHASIASTGIYTQVSREQLQASLEEVDGVRPLRKRDMRKVYEGRAQA